MKFKSIEVSDFVYLKKSGVEIDMPQVSGEIKIFQKKSNQSVVLPQKCKYANNEDIFWGNQDKHIEIFRYKLHSPRPNIIFRGVNLKR
jgi:hypothetical protein